MVAVAGSAGDGALRTLGDAAMAADSTGTLTERELMSALNDGSGESSPAEPASADSFVEPPPADSTSASLLIAVDDFEKALSEIEGQPPDSTPTAAPPVEDAATPAPLPAEATPGAAVSAPDKPLKFVIGKKSKPGSDGETPNSLETAGAAAASRISAPGMQSVASEGTPNSDAAMSSAGAEAVSAPSGAYLMSRRIYRGLESGLDLVSRPIARLGGPWLQLVGAFGMTTLIVSLGAMVLLPVLMPHQDAVTYLTARREAVANPPPPAAVEDAGGSHGAKKDASKSEKKPKADGHASSAKPQKKGTSGGSGH